MYEPKWGALRLDVVRGRDQATLWSRRGTDPTARFPAIAAAALELELVPPSVVLDGEVVVWNGDRFDFDLLPRRPVTGRGQIRSVARVWPATCSPTTAPTYAGCPGPQVITPASAPSAPSGPTVTQLEHRTEASEPVPGGRTQLYPRRLEDAQCRDPVYRLPGARL